MKFLKTLLWVIIVALAAGLAVRNWSDVTISLWGDLEADIKIPVLMLIMFVVGLVSAWLTGRARYSRLARHAPARPVATPAPVDEREGPAE